MNNHNNDATLLSLMALMILITIASFVAILVVNDGVPPNLATKIDLENLLNKNQTVNVNIPAKFDDLCENTDGCDDAYRVDNHKRDAAIDRVRELLEEDDNRDLHKFLNDFYDIDENEDIDSVSLHRIGRVRASEEFDSSFDLSDTLEITVEYAIEVEFYEDGNASDDIVKYFLVTGTLYDLEDGLDDGEIKNIEVRPISKDAALTSN